MRGSSPFLISSNWLWTRRRPSSYIHVQVSNPLTVSNRALLAMSIYPQVSLQNTHTFTAKLRSKVCHGPYPTSFFSFSFFFFLHCFLGCLLAHKKSIQRQFFHNGICQHLISIKVINSIVCVFQFAVPPITVQTSDRLLIPPRAGSDSFWLQFCSV